jgi:hypothetical protein
VPGTAWDGERLDPVSVTAAELVPTPYLAALAPELALIGERSEH